MESLRPAFGKAIRIVRQEKGWSQEKLAEVAGLDRTYISGLERGARNPALSTVERVAAALDVQLSTLLRQAEEIHSSPPPRAKKTLDQRTHVR
jgi:transcriptional regulator with XRE-family HTH domain